MSQMVKSATLHHEKRAHLTLSFQRSLPPRCCNGTLPCQRTSITGIGILCTWDRSVSFNCHYRRNAGCLKHFPFHDCRLYCLQGFPLQRISPAATAGRAISVSAISTIFALPSWIGRSSWHHHLRYAVNNIRRRSHTNSVEARSPAAH